jgi:hypothetical protein
MASHHREQKKPRLWLQAIVFFVVIPALTVLIMMTGRAYF